MSEVENLRKKLQQEEKEILERIKKLKKKLEESPRVSL